MHYFLFHQFCFMWLVVDQHVCRSTFAGDAAATPQDNVSQLHKLAECRNCTLQLIKCRPRPREGISGLNKGLYMLFLLSKVNTASPPQCSSCKRLDRCGTPDSRQDTECSTLQRHRG
ncbi:hypothetical protein NC651_019180 [Populus alba x Populus x berolinensis]|nr:hypothetical protein NC651_019173 [Populus alba x Populus x berolinensis]KAJ6901342.1 hypothetical protein NC651_019180 [Populus alba x Populus x berolinensis]